MPSPRRPRSAPPIDKTGNLKDRLVAAARRLLERDGFDALTLRAAAREVGVSHMAPYRHFENRDELLAVVAAQGFRALLSAMAQAASAGGPNNSAAGVAYVVFALDNPALYRLMFGARLAPRERFPELASAGAAAFAFCIEASKVGRGRATHDAEHHRSAIKLWSVVHGLADLASDGLVALPAAEPQRTAEIAAILESSGPGQ